MNKREAVIAMLALGAAPLRTSSQQPRKIPRIGLLGVASATSYATQIRAMKEGFRELGYVEGQSILIEYRWADGQRERLPTLAAELVRLHPDVLVTSGVGTRVLKDLTTTIPIVMAAGGDAVANGLIESLARPGGNITGSTFFGPEILAKRLEMLKETVPRLARAAVLVNPDGPVGSAFFEPMKKAAAGLNVELIEVPARSPGEFDTAFALILQRRADGLVLPDDTVFVANMLRIGELCAAKRLPGAGSGEFAEGGGLLVYGVNFPELWRRVAYFVDKILKGSKPAAIPVEQATKFSLAVNLRAAKALGITIPQALLVRADEVIR